MTTPTAENPLRSLEEWDDFVGSRYAPGKANEQFRNYETADAGVREFYRQNHAFQTLDFARAKKAEYGALRKRRMGIWQAAEFLNTLVDESDPDTDLSQLEHLLQTSEAIRAEGHPRWMVLTGFVHDLGKILCLFDEPQWAVVGDTFPVGCAWSDQIVFHDFFAANPDAKVPGYQTLHGVYEPHCGLDQVTMSWGHDEYLYGAVKDYLPEPALYMIRYHSFYPAHRHGAYRHLMTPHDEKMFESVVKFNPFDLYSKGAGRPDVKAVKPYYEDLIAEFFPAELQW